MCENKSQRYFISLQISGLLILLKNKYCFMKTPLEEITFDNTYITGYFKFRRTKRISTISVEEYSIESVDNVNAEDFLIGYIIGALLHGSLKKIEFADKANIWTA